MSFCVQYGNGATGVLSASSGSILVNLAAPCLGECQQESWPLLADSRTPIIWTQKGAGWHVGEAGDLIWLCAFGNASDVMLEAETVALYGELFAILGQTWQLQRIWHYLPRINEPGLAGLERYRAFCRGRSLAFETTFGKDFQTRLPAASAVGCDGDTFIIYACARRGAVVDYFENPLQVPAYRYSETYGPRAPGFARASLTRVCGATASGTERAAQYSEIYLSGTASIRDEHSLVAGGVLGQLTITVENLNLIAAQCGIESLLRRGQTADASRQQQAEENEASASACNRDADRIAEGNGCVVRRCFKVYLRNAEDYSLVSQRFNALLEKGDEVIYLRSDICRAELDIEIEASVLVRSA